MKKALIIMFSIFSIVSFTTAIIQKDDVKRLLHSNQGGIYLIISALVIPKLFEEE